MIIEIRNFNRVERFVRELPVRLDKELSKGNQLWMESLRSKAKLKAPVDTGELKESIKLSPVKKGKNVKQWKLIVDAPHALVQEEGFTPHRFFAGAGFNSSKMAGGKTYFVSKWTPFLGPALQENLGKLNLTINKSINRALK